MNAAVAHPGPSFDLAAYMERAAAGDLTLAVNRIAEIVPADIVFVDGRIIPTMRPVRTPKLIVAAPNIGRKHAKARGWPFLNGWTLPLMDVAGYQCSGIRSIAYAVDQAEAGDWIFVFGADYAGDGYAVGTARADEARWPRELAAFNRLQAYAKERDVTVIRHNDRKRT